MVAHLLAALAGSLISFSASCALTSSDDSTDVLKPSALDSAEEPSPGYA